MYQKGMNTNTMKEISLPSENEALIEYMAHLGVNNNLNSDSNHDAIQYVKLTWEASHHL